MSAALKRPRLDEKSVKLATMEGHNPQADPQGTAVAAAAAGGGGALAPPSSAGGSAPAQPPQSSQVLHVSWARRNRKHMNKERLRALFAEFGQVEKVFMVNTNRYALVTMARAEDAERAQEAMHERILPQLLSKRIFIKPSDYRSLDEKIAADARLTDASSTDHVEVPGLHVFPDFITEEEERALLDDIDSRSWHQTLQRRVQHYGYIFNYATNLPDTEGAPPIPSSFDQVIQRVAHTGLAHRNGIDQVTVNEYQPGQGIAAHVDTETAFEDGLFSLALESAVTFSLRHPDGVTRRLVFQEPRTLIALTGDARYIWKHAIASRKIDLFRGRLVPRQRRVSLTLRCVCQPYRPGFLHTNNDLPASQSTQVVTLNSAEHAARKPTPLESKFVHSVYDAIAPHFSKTRVHRWPGVREFLAGVPPGSLVADLGCGNGKYFGDACFSRKSKQANNTATSAHRDDVSLNGTHIVGSDRCRRLLEIAADVDAVGAQCLACDVVALPYREQAFDYTLSIAVLHHLSVHEHRVEALREMIRVTRDGGEGLVYVWALKDRNSAATDETRRKNPLRKKLASPEDGDSQVSGKVDDASRDSTSNPSAIARSQEVMVPWHLQKAYLPSVEDTVRPPRLSFRWQPWPPQPHARQVLMFRRLLAGHRHFSRCEYRARRPRPPAAKHTGLPPLLPPIRSG
eukprot:INCI3608.3.p1 GENE.INCI3608.3~~INCI3608.3.p1  ORF type:complete len:695 (+),score=92.55 INCI3608.3:36-2087(+)